MSSCKRRIYLNKDCGSMTWLDRMLKDKGHLLFCKLWAAYIARTILVLMKELGVRFENSISVLVSSAVPEGKGVSSSAVVEVATISAIVASHGLNIEPRELALTILQLAEVLGLVDIPSHIRLYVVLGQCKAV